MARRRFAVFGPGPRYSPRGDVRASASHRSLRDAEPVGAVQEPIGDLFDVGGGEDGLLMPGDAVQDFLSPVGVHLGEDVVEKQDGGTGAIQGEHFGLGEPEGKGLGSRLPSRAVGGCWQTFYSEGEVVPMGAGNGYSLG